MIEGADATTVPSIDYKHHTNQLDMKNLIIAAMMLSSAAAAAGQVQGLPYASTMYGENSGWTVINVVEGTSTWEDDDYARDFKNTPFSEGKEYSYDRKNPGDDWLISPAIMMEAGKEYKVSFWGKASSDMECYSLSMASQNTVEALSAQEAMIYDYDHDSMDWEKISKIIVPEAGGEYYFGFHCYSPEDGYNIYLTGFEIKENVFVPGTVTGLAVTPDLEGALQAVVTWTLPVLDSDGAEIPEGAVFNKVEVYRDGTFISELPGDALSFTDTEALGLTAGKHVYGIVVTVNDIKSSMAEIESRYIGSLPVNALPWTAGVASLTSDDFKTFYAVVKGDRSGVPAAYGWSLKDGRIQFDPRSKWNREDDWLILPKVKFENPGVYRVRVKAEYAGEDPALDVYKGAERNVAAMTEHIGTFDAIPSSSAETYVVFEITEPGEFYIAFYAGREEAGSSKKYFFDEIHIESSEALPLAVKDLAAAVEGGTVELTWTVPTHMNTGREIESIDKITVIRNGSVLTEIIEGVEPGAAMRYVDTPDENGIFKYSVIPVAGGKEPDTTPMTVTTPWVGDRLQALPYELDFSQSVDLDLQKSFWTILNNDKDNYTWSVKSTGMTLTLDDWNGGETDDMLVSPPFEIAPGKYIAKLNIKGGESAFPLQVGFVAENDEGHVIENPVIVELSGKNSYAEYIAEINTELEGRSCLAIYSNSEYDYDPYNVVMNRIQLERSPDSPFVSVGSIHADASEAEYFDLTGMKVTAPREGHIYIIRTNDGEVRKVIY